MLRPMPTSVGPSQFFYAPSTPCNQHPLATPWTLNPPLVADSTPRRTGLGKKRSGPCGGHRISGQASQGSDLLELALERVGYRFWCIPPPSRFLSWTGEGRSPPAWRPLLLGSYLRVFMRINWDNRHECVFNVRIKCCIDGLNDPKFS